jgi:hypothetical protein
LEAFNGVLQVNYSSGRYFSGSAKETAARLPFDAGFEVIDVLTCYVNAILNFEYFLTCSSVKISGNTAYVFIF